MFVDGVDIVDGVVVFDEIVVVGGAVFVLMK